MVGKRTRSKSPWKAGKSLKKNVTKLFNKKKTVPPTAEAAIHNAIPIDGKVGALCEELTPPENPTLVHHDYSDNEPKVARAPDEEKAEDGYDYHRKGEEALFAEGELTEEDLQFFSGTATTGDMDIIESDDLPGPPPSNNNSWLPSFSFLSSFLSPSKEEQTTNPNDDSLLTVDSIDDVATSEKASLEPSTTSANTETQAPTPQQDKHVSFEEQDPKTPSADESSSETQEKPSGNWLSSILETKDIATSAIATGTKNRTDELVQEWNKAEEKTSEFLRNVNSQIAEQFVMPKLNFELPSEDDATFAIILNFVEIALQCVLYVYASWYRIFSVLESSEAQLCLHGFVLMFCGKSLHRTLLLIEIVSQSGGERFSYNLRVLQRQYSKFSAANIMDNKEDLDNDNIPDVEQIPLRQLLVRKLLLFLRVCDPHALSQFFHAQFTILVAVAAALQSETVQCISLGSALGDVVYEKTIERYVIPRIHIPKGTSRNVKGWYQFAGKLACRMMCISVALSMAQIYFLVYYAVKGGHLMSKGLTRVAEANGHYELTEGYADEIISGCLALLGMSSQITGGEISHASQLLFFPMHTVESVLSICG